MKNLLNTIKEMLKLERFEKCYRFKVEVNDGRNEIFTINKHFHALTKHKAMKLYNKMFTSNDYTLLKVDVVN